MAPITVMDNELLGRQQDISLRARWESTAEIDPKFMRLQNMDPKAVGGHLLLGKRSSNPVAFNYNQLKLAASIHHQHQQQQQQNNHQQQQNQPQLLNIQSSTVEGNVLLQHRRLDRSQSEPLRPQQGSLSPTDGSRSSSSSRYKTELCRPFAETGFCKYGDKCQFAHGGNELRNMPRHPKYKTELCRTFHTTGLCGYGSRCHFIHNADERRNPSPSECQSPSPMGMPFNLKDDNSMAPSPPSSLSPSSQGGSFFDEAFKIHEEMYQPFIGLETPPISPVESLAGDMDSISISPNLSNSPTPANTVLLNAFKDNNFRLPIFEALTEVP